MLHPVSSPLHAVVGSLHLGDVLDIVAVVALGLVDLGEDEGEEQQEEESHHQQFQQFGQQLAQGSDEDLHLPVGLVPEFYQSQGSEGFQLRDMPEGRVHSQRGQLQQVQEQNQEFKDVELLPKVGGLFLRQSMHEDVGHGFNQEEYKATESDYPRQGLIEGWVDAGRIHDELAA